ncbi:MAG: 6-pyruvoyl tetrahydropterin synthase family protein [Methanopyri archaeon]|nr:6-pyruvoyl tetrahydropterin synthase family protein [Methanopyri archaeon]
MILDGKELGFRFSACHVIPGHPKCGRLHGHTYHVTVEIEGERMDPDGFVIDFDEVKEVLRRIIGELDHRVLVPTESDLFDVEERGDEVEVKTVPDGKRYVFPREDVAFVPTRTLSAEDLAGYLLEELVDELSADNIIEVRVRVDEGWGQGAEARKRLR